ncbi:MAG TPA: sugar phosphate nucleotidyltransferase, partial [Desulfobacteria bacterium]|nr:sugar phosphate nucleotidyltransferase [Desulfobacteria bacterium]
MAQVISVILAAGKGTRMKSKMPKVLHQVCGEPMLAHVVRAASEAGVNKSFVVIGHEAELVKDAMGQSAEYVLQSVQLGTGHAVMQAEPFLKDFTGSIIVLCGDTPLITSETINQIIQNHLNSGCAGTVLTADMDDPTGYGRVVRDKSGEVQEIVEHKDALPDQLAIREINTGIYCFSAPKLFSGLKEVTPANVQGEYYLTDVLAIMKR